MDAVLVFQLVLLVLNTLSAVLAASFARRAASFDVTRDFDELARVVNRLVSAGRSEQMKRVRAAALEPREAPQTIGPHTPLSKDQLRALVRAKNGTTQ